MPQINLLPAGQKKKETKEVKNTFAKNTPASEMKLELAQVIRPVVIRSSICFGVGLLIWVVLLINVGAKEKVVKGLEEQTKVLETNPIEIEKVRNERAALEKKVNLIDELSSRKFLWYEKLDQIGTIIPNGIWFTEISSSKIPSKDPSSGIGEKMFFIIRGIAVAYKIDDAVALIGDFIKSLQADKDFSKDFVEIKLNNVSKSTVGGLDVMRFDFLCESK